MTKTLFTTITPLPAGVSRETVLETFHDHLEMIDLNPAHESRNRIPAPPEASPEEYHCTWYQITDKISYMPGYSGKVHFKAVFNDLANGLQTHVYAPAGVNIKERWTIGGNAPGEPVQPAEIGIGAPVSGLYIREDVELKCNFMMTKFVRKQLKDALATLVARLLVKSQLQEAVEANKRLTMGPAAGSQLGRSQYGGSQYGGSQYGGSSWGGSQNGGGSDYGGSEAPGSPRLPMSPPLSAGLNMSFPKPHGGAPQRLSEQYSDGGQYHQQQNMPMQNQYQQQYQQPQYQQQNQHYQQQQPMQYQQSPNLGKVQQFQPNQNQQSHPGFVSEMDASGQKHPQNPHNGPVELA